MRVFDGRLHVHYGQAYVFSGDAGDTSDLDQCFRGQSNGLLGAGQPGMLFFLTGLHTGLVELTIDVVEHEPPLDDGWEEVVEVSFAPADADARLEAWGGDLVCRLPLEQRAYRVRYAARGMEEGRAADTILEGTEPIDAYALSFRPAAPAPDRILRQTSETAAYSHAWAQSL